MRWFRAGRFLRTRYSQCPSSLLSRLVKKFQTTIRERNYITEETVTYEEKYIRIDPQRDVIDIYVGLTHRLTQICEKLDIPCDIFLNFPPLHVDRSVLENGNFRSFQVEFLNSIINAVINGTGGIYVAPPAFGKTILIGTIVKLFPKAKIDIVSSRRDVIKKAYDYLSESGISAGLVTTGSRHYDRVTLYTVKSLRHSSFDADLVILDEAHELVTDQNFQLLLNYRDARFIALTATPDTRYDNKHERLKALVGPVLFQISYKRTLQAGLNVPVVVRWYAATEGYVPEDCKISEIKKFGLWRNERFNRLVAQVARKYLDEGKQVLILVDTAEHAENLSKQQLLSDFEVIIASRSKNASLDPCTRKERERVRKAFERREIMGVIATKIWSTGVSFNDLEVLVRADCTASHTESIQIPGRVSRVPELTDKEYGIVVDFAPVFNAWLERSARKRMKYYKEYGWSQILPDGRIIKPE